MKDYKKQYLDPRWQKRRLEILNKANWKCEKCKSGDKTLHVHHKTYIEDRDVWDYPDKYLVCLCEDCHKEEEICLKAFIPLLVDNIKLYFNGNNIKRLSSCLCKINYETYSSDNLIDHISYLVNSKKCRNLLSILEFTEYFSKLYPDNFSIKIVDDVIKKIDNYNTKMFIGFGKKRKAGRNGKKL